MTDVSVRLVKLDTVASVGSMSGMPGGDGPGIERDDGVETEGGSGVEGVGTRGPRRGSGAGDNALEGVRLDTVDSGSAINSGCTSSSLSSGTRDGIVGMLDTLTAGLLTQ